MKPPPILRGAFDCARTRSNCPRNGRDDSIIFAGAAVCQSKNPESRRAAAMNICFNAGQKVPLTLSQTSRRPKKMVKAPSAERKKTCVRRDSGLRMRQTEQPADQNAHGVEKCAGHTLTQRGRGPKRKPENFCPRRPWPVTQTRMADAKTSSRSPWLWIPTLYVAEGLPYALAMSVSVVLYKNLGVSNAAIAFYTSWLYLPWVIKPLWSPVVDLLKTRRQWIWTMQLFLGAGLAGVALTIPAPHFFQLTLAFFWLLAFSSATHDIAADGFYMLATDGARAVVFHRHPQHVLPRGDDLRAGRPGHSCRKNPRPHRQFRDRRGRLVFALAAGIFLCLRLLSSLHFAAAGGRRAGQALAGAVEKFLAEISSTRSARFSGSRKSARCLLFLLLYRLGEAQLVKMVQIFSARPARHRAVWA